MEIKNDEKKTEKRLFNFAKQKKKRMKGERLYFILRCECVKMRRGE